MSRNATKAKREPSQSSEANLGEALRALRQKHNWSLATVSEKSGLATSTLSRIENNRLSLTYEKLLQLSRGLGVDLAELLSGVQPQVADARTGRRAYTPPGAGRVIQTKIHYYRYLCTELTAKKMTPMIGTVTETDIKDVGGFLHHEGEEMVYVLNGTLEIHTEFYEPLRIEQGGCIYFDSSMGHAFLAVGGPVTFLSVCSASEPALMEAEGRREEALVKVQ